MGFFDPDTTIEIEGVLKSLSMRNPHVRFVVTVAGPDGEAVDWDVETSALSVLRSRGIARDFMRVGDRIRVAGAADCGRDFRVWSTVMGDPASFPMFRGGYPLTEEAEQVRARWEPAAEQLLTCWEKGMPHLMITPIPIEFERMSDDIRLRFEEDDTERIIHMSTGVSPPDGYSLLGFSTGRWEGSTLIVETTNIDAPRFDDKGVPQSREVALVERFTPSEDESRLDYRVTVTDPVNFTQSFDLTRYWVRRPEIPLASWRCGESQDFATAVP